MGMADVQTKALLEDNERFADLFNFLLYQGKPVIIPDQLHPTDTTGLLFPYGPQDTPFALQKIRDSLRLLTAKEDHSAVYLILGAENQTQIDYGMPARILGFDVAVYDHQLRAFQRAYHHTTDPKQKLSAGAEFLSHMKKTDRLIPVVTLVIYYGSEPWDAPTSLHGMLAPVNDMILNYVPDYRINLISARHLAVEELNLLSSDLRQIFGFLKYTGDKSALMAFVEQNRDVFSHMDRQAVETIETLSGEKFLRNEEKGDVVDMCQALVELREEGRTEGRTEGRVEGRIEGRMEGIVEMCKELGFDFDKAVSYVVKMLGITHNDDTRQKVATLW